MKWHVTSFILDLLLSPTRGVQFIFAKQTAFLFFCFNYCDRFDAPQQDDWNDGWHDWYKHNHYRVNKGQPPIKFYELKVKHYFCRSNGFQWFQQDMVCHVGKCHVSYNEHNYCCKSNKQGVQAKYNKKTWQLTS